MQGKQSIEQLIRQIFHFLRFSAEKYTVRFNITSQQGRLLEIISELQKSGRQVNRKSLEKTAFLKGSSVTSLLDSLENKGFITRNSSHTDGRAKDIRVTENGNNAINCVKELFCKQEEVLLRGFTQEDIRHLLFYLNKACANITENNLFSEDNNE